MDTLDKVLLVVDFVLFVGAYVGIGLTTTWITASSIFVFVLATQRLFPHR